jgi:hypothetical protein
MRVLPIGQGFTLKEADGHWSNLFKTSDHQYSRVKRETFSGIVGPFDRSFSIQGIWMLANRQTTFSLDGSNLKLSINSDTITSVIVVKERKIFDEGSTTHSSQAGRIGNRCTYTKQGSTRAEQTHMQARPPPRKDILQVMVSETCFISISSNLRSSVYTR